MAIKNAQAMESASALLRDLLVNEPRYRRKWQRRVERVRNGELSQSAVARVLAHHLVYETREEVAADETDLARGELRHKVRRALNGGPFASGTLELFIEAFEIADADAERLRAVFDGRRGDGGIAHTVLRPRAMVKHQWHRTVALFERYAIDREGALVHRTTLHTIKALEDGVDSYLFNHEPYVERIDVPHGGALGRHYEYGGGLQSDEIVFGRVLRAGERIALEYHTYYSRPPHPVTEVRRPARARAENIDIALQFAPEHRPARVWWAIWADHFEGEPVEEELVTLDGLASVRRFVPAIEQTVVGFRWMWEPSARRTDRLGRRPCRRGGQEGG